VKSSAVRGTPSTIPRSPVMSQPRGNRLKRLYLVIRTVGADFFKELEQKQLELVAEILIQRVRRRLQHAAYLVLREVDVFHVVVAFAVPLVRRRCYLGLFVRRRQHRDCATVSLSSRAAPWWVAHCAHLAAFVQVRLALAAADGHAPGAQRVVRVRV